MSKTKNVFALNSEKIGKISVVILAAGIPSRMTTYSSKLLIEIEKKTVYTRYIENIKKAVNDYEIIVVGGYSSDVLYNYLPNDVVYVENREYDKTNNGISLKLAVQAATTKNILLIYDSLILSNNVFASVELDKSFVISESTGNFDKNKIGIIHEKNKLENLSYDINEKWANIAFFTKKEYSILKQQLSTINDKTFVFEIINNIIDNNGRFEVINKNTEIKNINSRKDLK